MATRSSRAATTHRVANRRLGGQFSAGTVLTLHVLANDSDPDGDAVHVLSNTSPAHGTVVNAGTDQLRYTPADGYAGVDSFSYTIQDPSGATATATVHVSVSPANRPPLAVDDVFRTAQGLALDLDVLANDSDADGEPFQITDHTTPGHGSVVLDAAGHFSYTPDADYVGSDTFSYTITDTEGAGATATVTINVQGPGVLVRVLDPAGNYVNGSCALITLVDFETMLNLGCDSFADPRDLIYIAYTYARRPRRAAAQR